MLNETVFCFLFEEFYFRGLLLADDHGVHRGGKEEEVEERMLPVSTGAERARVANQLRRSLVLAAGLAEKDTFRPGEEKKKPQAGHD